MSYITYDAAKANQQEIISDYFDDSLGRWSNYGTYDDYQRLNLLSQKHTDLKSFYSAVYKNPYIVDLSSKTMTQLATVSMDNINAQILVKAGETWSISNPDTISTTGNWRQLQFSCSDTSKSVYSKNDPIDINAYQPTDYILVSLPNVPSTIDKTNSSISLTTDATASGFDVNQTNTIAFNAVGTTYTNDPPNNNVEFRIPLSLLTNVLNLTNTNKGLITGVKFTIKLSSGTGTFSCAGVRCVSSDWKYAPLDINTLEKVVVKTVPPNGALIFSTLGSAINTAAPTSITLADTSSFPTSGIILVSNTEYISYTNNASNTLTGITRGLYNSNYTIASDGSLGTLKDHAVGESVIYYNFNYPINIIGSNLPSRWPLLYKTFDDQGDTSDNDPKILNGSVYAIINTGASTGNNSTNVEPNVFSFYFRNSDRPVTQLELNTLLQRDLNYLSNVHDVVPNDIQITQGDLSKIPGNKANLTLPSPLSGKYQINASNLENSSGETQVDLSAIPGTFAASFLTGKCTPASSEIYQRNPNSVASANGQLQSQIQKITTKNISYLATHLQWYKDSSNLKFKINITDELTSIFTFNITNQLSYWQGNKILVFKATVIDNTIECKLFELKNNALKLIYTTNTIESTFFHSNRGLFGWSADLKDGQTQIQSIRSNRMIYGEYKSSVMNSITPVKGAQIFSNQTDEKELITEDLKSNQWTTNTGALSAKVDNTDTFNKKPVKIYTISDANTSAWQGIETNKFKIENFEDIYITFDLNFSSTYNQIAAFLYDNNRNKLFELNVPSFTLGQWQSIKLTAYNDSILPGNYSLVIVEDGYNNSSAWSIKKVSVKQRAINWQGRAFIDGGWEIGDRDWVNNRFVNLIPVNQFTDTMNSNDGMMFAKSDTELQVRAQALNQFVTIHLFDVQPKYATPGNFIWKDSVS
jgi:hypothetical protein